MESQHAQACLPSRLQFYWGFSISVLWNLGPPPCGETALCPVHVSSIPGLTFSCTGHFQMSAWGQSAFLRGEDTGSVQWTAPS